ncbi:MAG: cytochrome P460 family protein [Rhodospirillales bacterium]|nr:cytochrome P460 family protein [Rhodospirillales bacterium]
MKTNLMTVLATALILFVLESAQAADPAPNGIAYPTGWQNWSVVATSYRTDNETIRVILGNKVAVEAARKGETNPWPDGAILGKVVWKETDLPGWEAAKAPGSFVHAEFMFKDAGKYAETAGWGWARWKGPNQEPYGENADFSQECIGCHTPMADRDYVFTDPAVLPKP